MAVTAARSSTGPQSPPNCQVPYASGVTSRPAAPNVTVCIASSYQRLGFDWQQLHARQGEPTSPGRVNPQPPAAIPRAELSAAMIAPPTVIARNDRAKLVWKNLCRSQARTSSSQATTPIATLIAAP